MSVRFLGGLAAGRELQLESAPLLLRVVRNPEGVLAALNLPQDLPEPDEEVFAYVRQGAAFVGHVDVKEGRERRAVPFVNATYCLAEMQPNDETMRDNDFWWGFCDGYLEGVEL